MRISTLSLIAALAGTAAWQLQAQSANPEVQNRAVDLLRRTLAEERQAPGQTIAEPSPAAPASAVTRPASPDQQQQAVELVRRKIQEEKALDAAQTANHTATQPKATKTSTAKSKGSAAPGAKTEPSQPSTNVQPSPAVTSPAPMQPTTSSGPKTKQQRLMELLERYRADQLTPAEYHAERAKILSEP